MSARRTFTCLRTASAKEKNGVAKKRHTWNNTNQHRKTQEWANMKNKKQSKEQLATERGATKQNRKKTSAKDKSVGHKVLPAL